MWIARIMKATRQVLNHPPGLTNRVTYCEGHAHGCTNRTFWDRALRSVSSCMASAQPPRRPP